MPDSKGEVPGKELRLIDVTRPVATRNGAAAIFFCREMHRIYPLTFKVEGKMRSYSKWGEYNCCGDSPLDIFNVDALGIGVQLELFPELCA